MGTEGYYFSVLDFNFSLQSLIPDGHLMINNEDVQVQ